MGWYEDTKKRLEQKQQQEQALVEQQARRAILQKQQQEQAEQQKQQKLFNELMAFVNGVGARQKLDYIRQSFWGCGQIDPFQHYVETWCEAGLGLHFEFEALLFTVTGGYKDTYDRGGHRVAHHWTGPENKHLNSITYSYNLGIAASERFDNGDRYLYLEIPEFNQAMYGRPSVQQHKYGHVKITPTSDLASLAQQVEESLFIFLQGTLHPPQIKGKVAEYNQKQEEEYRRYKPHTRP